MDECVYACIHEFLCMYGCMNATMYACVRMHVMDSIVYMCMVVWVNT